MGLPRLGGALIRVCKRAVEAAAGPCEAEGEEKEEDEGEEKEEDVEPIGKFRD